jgi:hypothetical protein
MNSENNISSTKHDVHILDLLIHYFSNYDLNNQKFTYITWNNIYTDLLKIVKIKPETIKDIKNNNIDKCFLNSYNNLLNYNFDNYLLNNDFNKNFIYLNKVYEKSIVNSGRIEFKRFYIKILLMLWFNDKIIFENEKLGVVIYNILQKYDFIIKKLSYNVKESILNNFLIYFYDMYSNGKFILNQKDFIYINNKKYYNLIHSYAIYMFINLKNYINDYYIYGNTNIFFYVDSDREHLNPNSLSTHIINTYGQNFTFSLEQNIKSLFIDKKSYLYINNKEILYQGISHITGKDDNKIKNLVRKNKIESLLL